MFMLSTIPYASLNQPLVIPRTWHVCSDVIYNKIDDDQSWYGCAGAPCVIDNLSRKFANIYFCHLITFGIKVCVSLLGLPFPI